MEFYKVDVDKAKEEFKRISRSENLSSRDEEGMAYYKLIIGIQRLLDLDDIYLKHDYLSSRRMSDKQIEYLVSEGVLGKVELSGNESISISLKVKYRTDPNHAIILRKLSLDCVSENSLASFWFCLDFDRVRMENHIM